MSYEEAEALAHKLETDLRYRHFVAWEVGVENKDVIECSDAHGYTLGFVYFLESD